MQKPRVFIILIFIVSLVLLVLDLPGKIDFRSIKIPFI